MSALPITYKYEVYRQGKFLGVLPNVSSPFTYTQDINTLGSQIVITTAQDIDTQQLPVVLMTDESGNQMTDESGTYTMTTDRVSDIYGSNISNSMIQNGNEIKVWEYTQWQPNGVLVFDGIVKRWNPHIGSNDSVDLTVVNYGVELDNNILYGDLTIDQLATTIDPNNFNFETGNSSFSFAAQVFTTGAQITNISGVSGLQFTTLAFFGQTFAAATITASLYTYTGGNPDSGTLLATSPAVTLSIIELGNDGIPISGMASVPLTAWNFSSAIAVEPNTQYAIVWIHTNSSESIVCFDYSTDSYADGSSWDHFGSGNTWEIASPVAPLVFITYAENSENAFTNSVYFNEDPSAMVTNFMDNYISGDGHVGIGNITSSSAIGTYPFVLNTLLEGCTACLSMAPSGYYWYVDVGSNLLYFQPKSSTPDHIFTFKVHINAFELLVISETTINAAYLTGGNDTNGNAILVYAENQASINNFDQVLDRISDSRILDYPTAQLVINNYVETNSVENNQSTINIFASTYDLTTLHLGQIIGFNGFNTFADNLQLQIVNIARYSDYAQLTLGTVPKRASTQAQKIERSLLATQTINSPLSAI